MAITLLEVPEEIDFFFLSLYDYNYNVNCMYCNFLSLYNFSQYRMSNFRGHILMINLSQVHFD